MKVEIVNAFDPDKTGKIEFFDIGGKSVSPMSFPTGNYVLIPVNVKEKIENAVANLEQQIYLTETDTATIDIYKQVLDWINSV